MLKKFKKRKYISLLAILIISGSLFPLAAGAQTENSLGKLTAAAKVMNGTWYEDALAWLGTVFQSVALKIMGWAGWLLDYSIKYSMGGEKAPGQDSNYYNSGIVATGWTICRNISNLFFIFVLIFIGIATILQLQSYGYKKILIGVIVAALLVNFSGVITKMVIDSSNILAMEFICKMTNNTCRAENISMAMSGGLNAQTVYGDKGSIGLEPKEYNNWNIIMVTWFGGVIFLLTAFILFAAAFLFVARTLILMFLIMASPFAFIAMAIGSGIAKKWWHTLISQSFVAPVYLFFVYIVVAYINGTEGTSGAIASGGFRDLILNKTDKIDILWNFVFMGGLLLASLVAARQMGGAAATKAISFATIARRRAVGYAGRIAARPVAIAGEKVAETKTMEKLAAYSPKMGGWMREKAFQIAGAGGRKEQVEKLVKRGMTLPAEERAIYLTELGRGLIGNRQAQKEMFKTMSDRERVEVLRKGPERFQPVYDRLMKTLPIGEREKTEKISGQIEREAKIKRLGTKEEKEKLSEKEIVEIHKSINPKEFKKIVDEGGAAADEFFRSLIGIGKTSEEIAQKFKDMGNTAMASAIYSGPNAPILKAYGIEIAGEKGKEPKEGTREYLEKQWKEKPWLKKEKQTTLGPDAAGKAMPVVKPPEEQRQKAAPEKTAPEKIVEIYKTKEPLPPPEPSDL